MDRKQNNILFYIAHYYDYWKLLFMPHRLPGIMWRASKVYNQISIDIDIIQGAHDVRHS